MDEWIDPCEKARRQHEAHCKEFLDQLTKDIRRWEFFARLDIYFCVLNFACGLRTVLVGWVNDHLWIGLALSSLAFGCSGFLGWMARHNRRRVHTLRALRKSMVGLMKAETPIQHEHHVMQGNAAMRNLIAHR